MSNANQVPGRGKAVTMAILRALVCWIILYGIAVHAHILLLWWGGDLPSSRQQRSPAVRPTTETRATVKKAEVTTATHHDDGVKKKKKKRHQKKTSSSSAQLWQDWHKAETQQHEWIANMKARVSLLQHNVHRIATHPPTLPPKQQDQEDAQKEVIVLNDLRDVLEMETILEYLAEEDDGGDEPPTYGQKGLRIDFVNALNGIQSIVKQQDKTDWENVMKVLTNEYPREDPTTLDYVEAVQDELSDICTSPSLLDAQDDDTVVPPSIARESHLSSSVQEVENMLKTKRDKVTKRKTLPSFLTKDCTDRILTIMQKAATLAAVETMEELEELHDIDSEDEDDDVLEDINKDRNCVETDDITELVNEGLNAIQRHQDLRAVLKRTLEEIDPVASQEVILDAILPSKPSSTTTDSLDSNNDSNLRQVLDTPLVSQQTAVWLDVAVEHLSGHIDAVDEAFDSLSSSTSESGANEESSVGKVLVTKFLDLAGRIPFPNIRRTIPSKAGMLRP